MSSSKQIMTNVGSAAGWEGERHDADKGHHVDSDEESSPGAPPPAKAVRFSFTAPHDITGEALSFAGGDGEQKAAVEGIVEYGKGSDPGTAASTNVERISSTRRRSELLGRRKSSLDLRKNIPDSLLLLPNGQDAIVDDSDVAGGSVSGKSRRGSALGAKFDTGGCFHRLFLNPSYPLRRQLLLTFGSVSALAILLVMVVSIIAAFATGNSVKNKYKEKVVEEWVYDFMGNTSKYVAEALSPKIMPIDLIDLMVEIARDRFAGYPDTEDDSLTPFFDTQSETNEYPLKNNPLPLDWDFRQTPNEREGNVNNGNYKEHVQDRWPWYLANPRLSTEVAMYSMQGACDPRATDPLAMEYHPNCTDANNDISTGGVIAPSPTNEQVYRKAADLSPFLKALYEYHQEVKQVGYYFSNSGAGSTIFFPHYEFDSSRSYVSIGCEWMRTPNPINATLGPIGTEDEIARCHPDNTTVPTREYNPLERAWCRDQALKPHRVHNIGPYVDAWAADKRWLMTAGRAVYDLSTGAFISCIAVDFTIEGINKFLDKVQADKMGVITLVRNDNRGTIVKNQKFDFDDAEDPPSIDDPGLETGVDRETFDEIRSLIDFTQNWTTENATSLFNMTRFDSEEHIISAYPVPAIPPYGYDPTYEPEFFAIFTFPKSEGIKRTLNSVSHDIDQSVRSIVFFTVVAGLAGLAIVILFIFATASWFVEPLKWMQDVGDQVVGKFGENLDYGIDYERKKSLACSPKTELTSMAEEFSRMVTRFSGEGTAKRVRVVGNTEKLNLFNFSKEFSGLYRSREDSAFPFNYPKSSTAPDAPEGEAPQQCNLGPITRPSIKSASSASALGSANYSGKVHKSPLFHWMVGLIATPILVTTVVISAVVVWQISNDLAPLVELVEEEYFYLKDSYRASVTELLAIKVSAVSERAVRDTYLLNRFASWLYFGGMEPSGSFTEIVEGSEECKTAPSPLECEWTKDMPCDCDWNNPLALGQADDCTEYLPGESRTLQKVHFGAQSQDTRPDGSRNSTSFPEVATFPNSTAWWDNITALPDAAEDSARTKYGTSLDRVKIISALSTVFIPLYNYDKSNVTSTGLRIGFEADGLIAGYAGCHHSTAFFPFWRSTKANEAANLRPELCPLDKYGYDPRCQNWYHDGKRKAKAGTGNLHITAPYVFAEGSKLGQSITLPLIDPGSGEYIGQVVVDFLPYSTFRTLETHNAEFSTGAFSILITPESDVHGHDTVVGPGFFLFDEGKAIEELIDPDDAFQPILQAMKAGERGSGTFSRDDESVHIAYAPVSVRNYNPLNSSDIASGIENGTILVYSLAFAETESGMIEPWQSSIDFQKAEKICIGVLVAIISISALLVLLIAFRVTASMTEPILKLLDVVTDINCMHVSNNDMTKLSNFKGSCREVDSVYMTIEMLYKVLQFANDAFFSGDLEVAYQVLRDALLLFIRLDNKKAVAVASNNLGNTMLTIYRTIKAGGHEEMCGLSKKEVIEKGTAYFAHSIKLGEEAYDEFYNKQGWSEECLVFMQFLANRYFNRAVFFLTTSRDNRNRKEAESLGFRDLQIAADMDVEIVDQCLDMGFKINRVERYELMMSRVRGLLSLVELGYSPDELYLEDQIVVVYNDLKDAMKNRSHELFEGIGVAGRMQKLDVELMKYFSRAKKDKDNAAKVAIRMLIEDEYTFPDAEQEAIMMLLIYKNTTHDENCPADEDGSISKELRAVAKRLEERLEGEYVKRAAINSSVGSQQMRALNADTRQSRFSHEYLKDDITMELF